MTAEPVDDLGLADLPTFDEAALKRAIRRGIVRTAVDAVVILFAVSVLWTLIGGAIAGALIDAGPEKRAEGALIASHPGSELSSFGGGPSGLLGRPFTFTLRARDSGVTAEGKGKTSIRGRASIGPVSSVRINNAIDVVARDLEDVVTADVAPVLERLPPVRLSAVVALKAPTPATELRASLADLRMRAVIVYERTTGGPFAAPVSWPAFAPGPTNRSLGDWAASLRPEDEGLLRDLSLPNRAELRQIAKADLATGVVITGATNGQLMAFVRSPMVKGAMLMNADLDLSP